MTVAIVRVGLRLVGVHSLKDKRKVIRSAIARIRAIGQCSISEVGDCDLWGNAEIGLAAVGRDPVEVDQLVDHSIRYLEGLTEVESIFIEREMIRF